MATFHHHSRRDMVARLTRLRPEDRLREGPVLEAEWWEDAPADELLPVHRPQRQHPPDRAGHRLACTVYRQVSRFHA